VYRPGRHFPVLDGLRGTAILMVIACHVRVESTASYFDRGLLHALDFGQHGVDLFFVLSGFLITGILLDSKGSPSYFRTFYLRRTLRIFPLYYLYLGLRLLLIPTLAQRLHVPSSPLIAAQSHGAFFWLYGSNLLSFFYPDASIGGGLMHLWSLAVEEQFYLVWPLLIFFVPRRALTCVCIAVILGGAALRVYFCDVGLESLAYAFTLCRADALAAGSLVAIAVRRPWEPQGLWRTGFLLALSAAALIIGRMALWGWTPHETGTTTYGITLAVLLFVGLLLCAVSGGSWSAHVFNLSLLRRVGKYSYGMYVFHFFVFRAVVTVTAHVHFPGSVDTPLVREIVQFLAVSSLTFVVALGSWHGFEKWFLRLKDRFRYGAEERTGGPPVPVRFSPMA